MTKLSKLTPTIYNSFIKKFNVAANHFTRPEDKKLFIDARNRMPTYNELLAMDFKYVFGPTFVDETGNLRDVKSWMSNEAPYDGSLENVEYVYMIEPMHHWATGQDFVCIKVRGIHKEL